MSAIEIEDQLPGLAEFRRDTLGDARLSVAILDGRVDLAHPCFSGADLNAVSTVAAGGRMSRHGTHITSVVFGQPGTSVEGIAPRCRGLLVPIFRDDGNSIPQLELARAIEQAAGAGADVISISGGQPGAADPLLHRALDLCRERNILVVAAAGNEGCDRLQVPAGHDWVVAVGATTATGEPHEANNWGAAYQSHGIVAPGVDILGAVPGAATVRLTGSSVATAVVTGVAALLLSTQLRAGAAADPRAVRRALIESADECRLPDGGVCARCLAGVLSVGGARDLIEQRGVVMCSGDAAEGCGCGCDGSGKSGGKFAPSPIYAIGSIGYDFGSEARRDGFRQEMGVQETGDRRALQVVPANPYDPEQLSAYLKANPWASGKLIWTLSLDQTPIYALEAEPSIGMVWGDPIPDRDAGTYYPPVSAVHKLFHDAIVGQLRPVTDENYISRVSIPGVLTNRSVRLFSGQVVPVVTVEARGLYSWNEGALVDYVVDQVDTDRAKRNVEAERSVVEQTVRSLLDKVYYQFRNLGQSSPDRALNYAATNVLVFAQEISNGLLSGQNVPRSPDQPEPMYMLDTIDVAKSPVCRMDSDCWDVRITFFDPENERRARSVLLFTIDVSDVLPVTLGPTRQYFTGQ